MVSKAPGPYAPPPYRQPAGGSTFFKVLPGIHGLAQVWIEAAKLYTLLGSTPHPAARAKRQLLARHIAEMEARIREGEILVAEATDTAVRAAIRATQVRPDNPKGPAMVGGISSRPIPFGIAPGFSVGQVDIGALDAAATGLSGKPYWPSQEFGYAGNVGKRVKGFFAPGLAAPSQSQFRLHPVFKQTAGNAPVMVIQRPIEERAFLRAGAMQGALARARLWSGIEKAAVKEVARIITFGGPIRRATRRP